MVMSEDERSALRAIEENLAHADPAFAARMGTPEAATRPSPTLSVLCAAAYILVPLQALLFGWRSALVTLGLVAATVATVLIRRRGRPRQ